VPRYPHELPDGVVLDLLPFCPTAVEGFLKVENPQYSQQAPGPDHSLLAGRRPALHLAHAATMTGAPSDAAGTPSGPEFDGDWTAVYPMIANPRGDDYADPGAARRLGRGQPDLVSLRDQALVLLANPLPCGGGRPAGPTFEWAQDR
jgi:hypothetical protein